MDIFSYISLLWMTLLSIAMGYLAWLSMAMRRRTHELDLSEQLHYITRQITLDMIRRDDRMHGAVRTAIAIFEENKILMDKYWGDYHNLKQILK